MTRAGGERLGGAAAPRSIAANTIFSLVLQGVSSAFTVGLTLFLVRELSPNDFGLLGLALAIGGLLLLPAEFGIGAATGRYVAQHAADPAALSEIVGAALALKIVLTGLTCLTLGLSAGLIADVGHVPGLAGPLRAVAVVVFFQSTMNLCLSIANALGRVDLNLWVILSESLVETGLAVLLVLAGAGAVGALSARAVAFGAAAAIGVVIVRRIIPRTAVGWDRPRRLWARRLLGYGGALLVVDSAFALFSQIDIVLIAAFLSTSAVGAFAAPLRFTVFLMLPAGAITSAVAYRLSREDTRQEEVGSFVRAIRHVLIIQAFMIAPLLVWAVPISDVLFGRGRYPDAVGVLRALVPFVVLSGLGNLFSLTTNYLGQARRRVPIAIATVIINCALDVVLIPQLGVVGGAIGTDIAYGFYAPAHIWICSRILGLTVRPVLRTGLGAAAAAVAMSLVLAAVGTGHLGVVRLAVGAVLAVLAYGAVIVATGALSRDERKQLLRRLRPRRGGSRRLAPE
ncbi:MAG: hypothetical protein QOJ34_971 [Pseudonocardiales bacterium]|nr:hypothetical protein [Pseudonocardiales bacterium]